MTSYILYVAPVVEPKYGRTIQTCIRENLCMRIGYIARTRRRLQTIQRDTHSEDFTEHLVLNISIGTLRNGPTVSL